MKFKVTATIPIELEIDCQSKKEALDTATTILQEQRYDDDYASIVADCIESALVSGSVNMTATDNHEALVNELRTKRKISIMSSRSMSSNTFVNILRKARNVIQVRIPKREQKSFSFSVNTNTTCRPIPDYVPTVLRSFR